MSSKWVQRGTVVGLVVAVVAGAIAAHLVSTSRLHARRTDRVATVWQRIADSVGRRALYLEDLADMVGVHDDADTEEFFRWAHVRGRGETGVVSVQWLRRSPDGRLVTPRDEIPGNGGTSPTLLPPVDPRDRALANVARQPAAAQAIALSSGKKQSALSSPVRLANGHTGFYLAVPIEAHRFSGDVSRTESRSSIVGLIDAQALVAAAFRGHEPPALRLRDQFVPLARIGSGLNNAVRAAVPVPARGWTVSVDGGSIPPLERALPWVILAVGLGLALSVAVSLRHAARRRDAAIRLAQERTQQLEQAHADAELRSREDALTGIFNRRHFSEVLDAELARVSRGGPAPALLLLDLDHFKRINDHYGHNVGDAVLQHAAQRIGSVLREPDCFARWGGEEFVILAPQTDRAGAVALAERLRQAVDADPMEADGVEIPLTVSVGVAAADDGACAPDSLIEAADNALYAAKHAGRNRVAASDLAAPIRST